MIRKHRNVLLVSSRRQRVMMCFILFFETPYMTYFFIFGIIQLNNTILWHPDTYQNDQEAQECLTIVFFKRQTVFFSLKCQIYYIFGILMKQELIDNSLGHPDTHKVNQEAQKCPPYVFFKVTGNCDGLFFF